MFDDIKTALMAGNINGVKQLVEKALSEGRKAGEILEGGLIAGMDVIGNKFKCNEVFIPEVMIAAKAMHAGLDVLGPYLESGGVKPLAKVVIGTVKGDLHDIGKNIVGMMFRGAGFTVIDCGIDVAPKVFVAAVKKENPGLLAMSSLLTTSMGFMGEVISMLKKEGLGANVRTMVGGAPVTGDFAARIGADGYAEDAGSAVEKARELLNIVR